MITQNLPKYIMITMNNEKVMKTLPILVLYHNILLYRIPIENIPLFALCDINRNVAYPCDINLRDVIKYLYHNPRRQSSDVISHPLPLIIGYYDEEFGMRSSTLISEYDVK